MVGPDLSILAGHTYTQAGSFTITISAVGGDGIPDLITQSATVSAPSNTRSAGRCPGESPSREADADDPLPRDDGSVEDFGRSDSDSGTDFDAGANPSARRLVLGGSLLANDPAVPLSEFRPDRRDALETRNASQGEPSRFDEVGAESLRRYRSPRGTRLDPPIPQKPDAEIEPGARNQRHGGRIRARRVAGDRSVS